MDQAFKILVATGGVAASFLFGGWSSLLSILLAFAIIDYVAGVAAAGKEGKLASTAGLWGIAKKVSIFAIVATAHLVDTAMGSAHLFRDATIFFYLANEVLSVLENIGRLGAPIPPVLRKAIDVLNGKSEGEKDHDQRL